MARPRVLFIAHRIPFPPHKGDKLRAWHLLQGLASQYEVTLAAVIDDPADRGHAAAFEKIGVRKVLTGDICGRSRASAGVRALASGEPVTFAYFRSKRLMRAIAAEPAPDLVYVYSSGAAPYLEAVQGDPPVITDFVDVDSLKWQAMAGQETGAMARVHAREARLLLAEEARIAALSARSLLVSPQEAELFREMTGVAKGVETLENGVDIDYWAVGRDLPRPYPRDGRRRIIMTGAMDYPPNVEGALWMLNMALPHREDNDDIEFVIAGANPAPELLAFKDHDNVRITRRVEDMRPWLAHADIAVAPLHIARGVQNKVLEAMASGTPVIATAAAATGIHARGGEHLVIADNPTHMAALIDRMFTGFSEFETLATAAEALVRAQYSWRRRFVQLHALIDTVLEEHRNVRAA